jgi:hypothetical protein
MGMRRCVGTVIMPAWPGMTLARRSRQQQGRQGSFQDLFHVLVLVMRGHAA